MDLHLLQKTVEHSAPYSAWKKEHADAYLAHAFAMRKGAYESRELGYYWPKDGTITTFATEPSVTLTGSDKPLGEGSKIERLDLATVRIGAEQAMRQGEAQVAEKFSSHTIVQRIAILQSSGQPVWNLTLVTNAFALFNIRINAHTGHVPAVTKHNLMGLGDFLPGRKE